MSPDLGAQTHNFGPQVSYQGVQRADRFGQLLYLLVHESQVLCSFFAQVLCSTQPDEVGTRAKQYSPEQDELCIAVCKIDALEDNLLKLFHRFVGNFLIRF